MPHIGLPQSEPVKIVKIEKIRPKGAADLAIISAKGCLHIRKKILALGFDVVGFTNPTVDKSTSNQFKNFLDKNHHGEMKWLERHYPKKSNPKKIWEEVKTIIVVGLNYAPKENPIELNNFKDMAKIQMSLIKIT